MPLAFMARKPAVALKQMELESDRAHSAGSVGLPAVCTVDILFECQNEW